VCRLVVQLLGVIRQQAARIAALEALVSENSRNSDRPPLSDPPFVTRSSSAPTKGTPGSKPGHPGHRQALLEPTEVIAERALRFTVLWRKMMQGTSNAKVDRWVERILSARETCRLRGRPTFPVLVHAVTCYFKGQPPDASWI
jgi:hypothetical protein